MVHSHKAPKGYLTGNVRLSAVLPEQSRQYWQVEFYKQNELIPTNRMVSPAVRGYSTDSSL